MSDDDMAVRAELRRIVANAVSNDDRLRAAEALAVFSLADAVRSLAAALTP